MFNLLGFALLVFTIFQDTTTSATSSNKESTSTVAYGNQKSGQNDGDNNDVFDDNPVLDNNPALDDNPDESDDNSDFDEQKVNSCMTCVTSYM